LNLSWITSLNKFINFYHYCFTVICAGVFADVWKVQVESEMEALVSSCVVLPCSFKYPAQQQPSDRIRAIWHMKDNWDDIIFHEDSTRVKDSFKRRTRLIGSLGASNCSLEIDEISVNDKYSFMDNSCLCFFILCEIRVFTPVRPTSPLSAGATLDIGHGNWEAESLLIFTPMKEDDYTSITCTVKHHGNIKGEITATHPIFVKGIRIKLHIIILGKNLFKRY
uniref:Uncharacterized protein n=1 Tax=Cyprinus carpio TaxID=7962 RepID=A0A8C1MHL7_CYPCA